MQFFLVGGSIRDELMGLKSKDIDIAVEAPSWEVFLDEIRARHATIYKEEKQYFRIKALGVTQDLKGPIDYTMCRQDGFYTDGRHPDTVEICDIMGDLSRRDFTVNAMARNLATGELLDPHNGRLDLERGILRCVGNPEERMKEDGLRWFRALRFQVMKGFTAGPPLRVTMAEMMLNDPEKWFKNTSTERIREELRRCFFYSTQKTLIALAPYFNTSMLPFLAGRGLWLNPTTQQKMGHGE
jgi:tRNA nucleotidyltransferase (CCA-adding enzyme)